MHTGTPFVSVGFTTISVLLQTLGAAAFFFHTILFQLQSPEPSIYHTVSRCVYIQTSSLHIFHTISCYVSAAKPPNHLQLYNALSIHAFFSLSLSHYQQNEVAKGHFRKLHEYYFPSVSSNATAAVEPNVHVKYNLLLAMVSLAVAVSVTVRMALFWACQPPMSPLSLEAPQGLSVPGRSGHFGQIAALRGKAEHVTFISTYFRG